MRIPRDLSGRELCQLLRQFGYTISHQTGSHIRLTTQRNGEHHITIPDHDPLRIGTLNAILTDIAGHLAMDKHSLMRQLWG